MNMEVKKEKLQALYEVLTNNPAVSKEQVMHEFHKAFGEDIFKSNEEKKDADKNIELKDIQKSIKAWCDEDKDNRCSMCVIAEMGKDNVITLYTSLLGNNLNIKTAIANAFEDNPKIPFYVNDAVRALVIQAAEKLLGKEKEGEQAPVNVDEETGEIKKEKKTTTKK